MNQEKFQLLFLSTPLGPLGSGKGGGVELTIHNVARSLIQKGHQVHIVAPEGSELQDMKVIQVAGEYQEPAQNQARTAPIPLPKNSVLANMWDYARPEQGEYDVIVNFSYDWLPLYLTPFFRTPIAHLISMGSLTDAMDDMIAKVLAKFPGTVGVHGQTQAATFPFGEQLRCLINGIDLSLYQFCAQPGDYLAWVGRLAPEKGLEDAVAAAQITGAKLKIFGLKDPESYWQEICAKYPDAPVEYAGFFPTIELQKQLGQCRAVLVTPRWVEAYPNVALESLACGVPLLAYRRGGLAEIVQEGKTGWLVEPDSVDGLVEAIGKIDQLDRAACRRQAEQDYALPALANRFEAWFRDILTSRV